MLYKINSRDSILKLDMKTDIFKIKKICKLLRITEIFKNNRIGKKVSPIMKDKYQQHDTF